MKHDEIVKHFQGLIGDDAFISPSHLVKVGIFKSSSAVRDALRRGIFPFVKISTRRFLIPRESVLQHLESNIVEGNGH